jgi:hypothetical protein
MEISLGGLSFSSVRDYTVSDCRMIDENDNVEIIWKEGVTGGNE